MTNTTENTQSGAIPDEDVIARLAELIAARVGTLEQWERLGKTAENTGIWLATTLIYVLLRVAVPLATATFEALTQAIEATGDQRGRILSAVLRGTFGVDIPPAALSGGFGSGGGAVAGQKVTEVLIKALTGDSRSVDPSPDPARRYMELVLRQALEGWQTGAMAEMLSSAIPIVEQMQLLGEASSRVTAALGISDSSSRVLRPYIDTLVVEPLRRFINHTYRPTELSAGEIVRQVKRGRIGLEQAREELAQQGYNDARIDALFAAHTKYLGVPELDYLVRAGIIDIDEAIRTLREQGWDEQTASKELLIRQEQRLAARRDDAVGPAVSAYVNRAIGDAELGAALAFALENDGEREAVHNAARVRRDLNRRELSAAQTREAVKAEILNVRDYRRALEREGYTADAVLTLELLLRHELDERARIEELRQRAEEERRREKEEREKEKAKRKAEIEQRRREQERGPLAPLEQAAIRGLIPLARVEELYAFEYDAETVGILAELLAERRADYLAAQEARAAAKRRGEAQRIGIGDLEQAVHAGVLSVGEYRRELERRGLAAGDVGILAATLEEELRVREEARAKRRQAEAEAGRRSIDLGRFERLVRRGVRSVSQYEALVRDLGFDDGSVAAMRELLELTIADDAAARAARARAEAELQTRGLSLEQFRRGVILGVKAPAEYEAFLVAQRFNADAIRVLMAELREDLREAEEARARRAAAEAREESPVLPLASLRRAAQLGIIAPDTYLARLRARGYSDDDAEIELELLLIEVSDVQHTRARREAGDRAEGARELSLGELERAIKAGIGSVEQYRARALELGYSQEAADTLTQLLSIELAALVDARRRRQQIAGELEARDLSLAQLEESVKKGFKTLEEHHTELRRLGYSEADAELLTALLLTELEEAEAKRGGAP